MWKDLKIVQDKPSRQGTLIAKVQFKEQIRCQKYVYNMVSR